MRDGASTNGVAVRTFAILYPNMLDVKCFAHTLDCVREHFNIPVLNRRLDINIQPQSKGTPLLDTARNLIAPRGGRVSGRLCNNSWFNLETWNNFW